LGDAALETQTAGSVTLPISQVEPGLKQPRKRFDEEKLAELADSIRSYGIMQPLTVRRLGSGYYQIIAGERRWRAAKLAGLTEVPVSIIEADDKKVMELGLIENLQREDLNPMEEAKGYQVLMKEYGLTQEEVAERVGKARPTVANALRLIALPDPIQALVEEGKLSPGHARAVLSLPTTALQKKLAQKIVVEGLSVRKAESLAKSMATAKKQEEKKPAPDALQLYRDDAAKQMSQWFSRKVTITKGPKRGKLVMEFYDDEDLTRLVDLLEAAGKKGAKK